MPALSKVQQSEKRFDKMESEIEALSHIVRGNGEKGLAARMLSLESTVRESIKHWDSYIEEMRAYRLMQEKVTLDKASQISSDGNEEPKKKNKSRWSWFTEKILPTVTVNLIMIFLLVSAYIGLPVLESIVKKAVEK